MKAARLAVTLSERSNSDLTATRLARRDELNEEFVSVLTDIHGGSHPIGKRLIESSEGSQLIPTGLFWPLTSGHTRQIPRVNPTKTLCEDVVRIVPELANTSRVRSEVIQCTVTCPAGPERHSLCSQRF